MPGIFAWRRLASIGPSGKSIYENRKCADFVQPLSQKYFSSVFRKKMSMIRSARRSNMQGAPMPEIHEVSNIVSNPQLRAVISSAGQPDHHDGWGRHAYPPCSRRRDGGSSSGAKRDPKAIRSVPINPDIPRPVPGGPGRLRSPKTEIQALNVAVNLCYFKLLPVLVPCRSRHSIITGRY
jgi:hypothetical protein